MQTTGNPYAFDVQLAQGEESEKFLDAFFGRWYEVVPVTPAIQRRGIDRFFLRPDGSVCTVEYKADRTASKTGNAFLETVSVSTTGKLGWAYTSEADYLIYYLPGDLLIYVLRLDTLRLNLDIWRSRYPLRRILNETYHSEGLLIPLREFEVCALEVINL